MDRWPLVILAAMVVGAALGTAAAVAMAIGMLAVGEVTGLVILLAAVAIVCWLWLSDQR